MTRMADPLDRAAEYEELERQSAIALAKTAKKRLKECRGCGEDIEPLRIAANPHTVLCRFCSGQTSGRRRA